MVGPRLESTKNAHVSTNVPNRVSKSVFCFELSVVVKHCSQVNFGFGVTTSSCVQVAFSPGCVHIRFSHSWFTAVSNPLAEPLFLHSSMVTVLPFLLLPLSLVFLSLSACPGFFCGEANAVLCCYYSC